MCCIAVALTKKANAGMAQAQEGIQPGEQTMQRAARHPGKSSHWPNRTSKLVPRKATRPCRPLYHQPRPAFLKLTAPLQNEVFQQEAVI